MKWCFLINDVDLAMEFLGKLSEQVLQEGNIRFITSYCKNTISGSMCVFDWHKDPNNYKQIYENVKKIYEQIQL